MAQQQFAAQIERLIELRYPRLLGLDEAAFGAALAPLSRHVPERATPSLDVASGSASFVLVINSALAPARATLPLIERRGVPAVERLHPIEVERFVPIEAIELPAGQAYLMLDIERGEDTRNVTPEAAFVSIGARERTPLTIEEGVALLTHFPEFLQPNHCFSLLASRCGDKRVPAFWLSEGRPKLGWCWAGNPHTWLGSASCGARSCGVELALAAA